MSISHVTAFGWIVQDYKVYIGSGDGFMPLGIKPLPEPVLISIHVALWSHKATMS